MMLGLSRRIALFLNLNRRDYRTLLVTAFSLSLLTCAWVGLVANSSRAPTFPRDFDPIDLPGIEQDESSSSGSSGSGSGSTLAVDQIVFGIAGSASLWIDRKELVRQWWRPLQMRGFVWHDDPVEPNLWDTGLPPIRISEDTSRFRYTNVDGSPAGIRIARIVLETVRMNLTGVEWLVLCDDDTVFSVDNLVRVLGTFDSSQMFYIGSVSESHNQNVAFSHQMAFGGGGIAISYPLAKALARSQDRCLEHYPQLTGSDDRLYACILELGVPLTKHSGFHQMDIRGNPLGLLSAHPITPFVSMHHIEAMDPVFPELSRLESLQLLIKAMTADSSNFLQQTIGYNKDKGFTFSISTGYVVQVFDQLVYPRVLEKAEITFKAWNSRNGPTEFDLDTRKVKLPSPPFLFFLNNTMSSEDGGVVSEYKLYSPSAKECKNYCWSRLLLPGMGHSKAPDFDTIRVVTRPLSNNWFKVPRRQCCRFGEVVNQVLSITILPCEPGETVVNRRNSQHQSFVEKRM
ncbi:uncharacterized protein LOC9638254 [Selaginella moellendorffii]|nr:uncharacterized protein LOC9638254 [Selaginella moellendorffii]|eukprot:XP_002973453.2 uncharacterized protein LOC9638254 [Selaginella moellendorffii]